MTRKLSYIKIIALIIALGQINGCKDDGVTPDPLADQLKSLENGNKSWILTGGSVVKDGFDVSDQFAGFQLTISGNNFSTANSVKNVWPNQGTWSFHQGNVDVLERSDGVLMNIILTANTLQLTFTDPLGSSGGRVQGIPGDYVFVLQSE